MTIDAAQWQAFLQAHPPRAIDPDALTRHREGAKIVAMKLEDLQASSEWDVFRLHVEQIIGALELDYTWARDNMLDATGEALLAAKDRARDLRVEIRVWRDALALPERLRQQAEASIA